MNIVRDQHAVLDGWSVLYNIGGVGITVTFPNQPTQNEIDEYSKLLSVRNFEDIENTKIILTEEVFSDDI